MKLLSIFSAVAIALSGCTGFMTWSQSDAGKAEIAQLESFAFNLALRYFTGGLLVAGNKKLTKTTATRTAAEDAVIAEAAKKYPDLTAKQITDTVSTQFAKAAKK